MKKRIFFASILVCLLFSSCGSEIATTATDNQTVNQTEEQTTEENSSYIENETVVQDKSYTISKIEMPDANMVSDEIVPDGYRISNETWGLAYGTVYRFFNLVSTEDDSNLGSCIQTLKAPYTEWEYQMITPEEWIEGDVCKPGQCTLTDYGELHILLEGTEGYYLGKWSLSKGAFAKKIDCEYQIFNHSNWCTGDTMGNYFIYLDWKATPNITYQMLWLDSDFEKKEGLPQEGYVWQLAENYYSGTPYLFGMDADEVTITGDDTSVSMSITNSGFTIWAEGQEEPVFTTPYTGMNYDDVVLFSTDTEGYLLNASGIWNFSIDNQLLTQIKEDRRTWHDACLRDDGSVLLLSQYYDPEKNIDKFNQFDYYLWEMVAEDM
uniref:hypothetical protein n=1 Tax=Acetatifactor sp. TaxID=1872090 RepID=UPI004055B581